MSEASSGKAQSEELTPDDGYTPAAEVIRKPTPAGLRAFGFLACLVVTWVFLKQGWDWFQTDNRPLNTLDPKGPNAQAIQDLVNPVFLLAAAIGIVVIGAVCFIAIKYREKPDLAGIEEFGKQTEGNKVLEIVWTLVPAVLLAVIGFFTVSTISKLDKPEPDAMKVEVFGQQWWWGFRYHLDADGNPRTGGEAGAFPEDSDRDIVAASELVIPVGQEVSLRETSNDVIHSFWIPNLNGKKDAVPGMYTHWKLKGDKPGVFLGQCTEFCGLSHANMRMLVRIVPPDEFRQWLDNQRKPARDLESESGADPRAVAGQKAFKSLLCSSCHRVRGINDSKVAGLDQVGGKKQPGVKDLLVSGTAPDLTHFASRGMFAGAIFNSHYPNRPNTQAVGYSLFNRPENPCRTDNVADGCGDPRDVANPGDPANPMWRPALAAWLRDPGKAKPMANLADENPYADGVLEGNPTGKLRGMPNLGLTEEQIELLIAYLETLR